MVAAVRVHKTGGPEVLTYEEVEVPAPGFGQVKIRNRAIGVNFIDTYFRMGMYPSPVGLPFVSGNEAAGEVTAVGPGVTYLKVGDRVGYTSALGSYAAERILPAGRAVKLPDEISFEQAAAMMLKGMTAQYLLRRTYKVQKGDNVLIHAAAGGVGLIACQWANYLGANVIGTVGSKDKAELAKKNGAHHVILYRNEDFVAKVKEIMAQQNPVPAGLRVGVVGGGCSGFSYSMSFENSAGMMDKTFTFDGLKVYVDATSVMYLNGCVVDYVETLEGAGFKFENPNVKNTCGCGSSFSV